MGVPFWYIMAIRNCLDNGEALSVSCGGVGGGGGGGCVGVAGGTYVGQCSPQAV